MVKRISKIAVLCLVVIMMGTSVSTLASNKFPEKPVNYIICFNPGANQTLLLDCSISTGRSTGTEGSHRI